MASNRGVRAFAGVANSTNGQLQRSSAKSSDAERQFANPGETMTDGGNSSGRTLSGISPYFADNFQGRSGQPDNQSIHRPKGST